MKKILLLILFSFSLEAQEIPLDQYKGKVVYLDFWASWCPPCALSFPWMQALQKKYKNKDFMILTVNVDEDKSDALNFIKKYKADEIKVIYDPKGKFAEKYKIETMPTSFLYNKKGELVSEHKGFTKDIAKKTEQEIESLLKD